MIRFSKKHNPSPSAFRSSNRGFSLIITVTMLILLAMISVGLLSLSTTQIRSSNSNIHQLEARANARLALQIAMGKLQKYAGPDTRVTASASLLEGGAPINPSSKHWTGVWSTDDQKNEGAPALSQNQPVWLVSGNDNDLSPNRPANTMSSLESDVTLASAPSNSGAQTGNAELKVPLEGVRNAQQEVTGAYAYAISDENLKAAVGIDSNILPRDRAKVAAISNPALVEGGGGRPFDGRDWYGAGDNSKIVSLDSLQLIGGGSGIDPAVEFQHDLTNYCSSLLTDPRLGGLKLDLSNGLEGNSSSFGKFLRETPHQDLIFDASNEKSDPGGPKWNQLRSFLTNRVAKGVSASIPVRQPSVDDAGFAPVIALMQWGLKVYVVPHLNGQPVQVVNMTEARRYSGATFYSFYCPSLVLWNPYDVDMQVGQPFYQASFRKIEITGGSRAAQGFHDLIVNDQPDGLYDGAQVLRMSLDVGTIEAGKTVRFGVKNTRLFSDDPAENVLERVDDALSVKGFYHVSRNTGAGWSWRGIATATVGFEKNFWNAHTSLNLSSRFEPDQKLISVNHGGWDKDFGGTPFRPTVVGLADLPTESGSGNIVYGNVPSAASLPNLNGYEEHKHDLLLGVQYFIPFPFSDQVRSPQNFINWRNGATTKSFQIDMLSLGNLRSPFFTRLATGSNASRPYGSNPIYLSGGVKNNLGQPFTTWINPGLGTNLGYSMDPGLGVENLALFQKPDNNKVFRSIAELSQANLFNYRDNLNRFGSNNNPICFAPTYAIGNSYSGLLSPLDQKEKDLSGVTQGGEGFFHDYSYKLNEELWDHFFFSTVGQGIADDGQPENDRLQVVGSPPQDQMEDPLEVARHLRIRGGFNVNSVSVNA